MPRALHGFHSPEGLLDLLRRNRAEAEAQLQQEGFVYLGLRDYQRQAIRAVETSLAAGHTRCLLAMATGTGKTRTIIGLIYRLLKAERFRRILFLVDRTALGTQALDAFNEAPLEHSQPLAKIYNIAELGDMAAEAATRVQVATVQAMVKRLFDSDAPPAVDAFDCLIVDEAHRGYTLDQEMTEGELTLRDPAQYLGFVEVHIEQGPVLNEVNIPLGVVTSINGSVRYLCEVIGTASHAGTTPMDRRRDAACAVAELALYMEQRAAKDGDSVATIGQLQVPNGSINVVPGRCLFSLDMRAPTDAQRDALVADVMAQMNQIAERRGVRVKAELTMSAAAAPSAPDWQARWERAVSALGVPMFKLPSGAGHDAMKLHEVMPQAMLFVRGENAGISHNPLESTTSDDMQLCVDAFTHVLNQLAQENS